MSTNHILVIDDEQGIREVVADWLERAGLQVSTVPSGSAALERVVRESFSVALVDLNMPVMSGMETMRRMKDVDADLEVIILTAFATVETSIEAMHEHVFDYLCKPIDMKVLTRTVQRAVERRQLVLDNRRLLHQLENERSSLKQQVAVLERGLAASCELLGESVAIGRVRHAISEVAPSDMTVLIRGESGTGKDVVARLLHEASGRNGTFVKINCPAVPESLLESELFGHEAGAFTGANRRKPGRFELAGDGTVFLDEIGSIPSTVQAKLLQVVEHRQFTRVGGGETIQVKARLVVATNAPLERMIEEGDYRLDLFYRLNEYVIEMPALRQRSEDIPLLVQHFLREASAQDGGKQPPVPPEMMARLVRHHWPGNVRELKAVVARYALTGREQSIEGARGQKNAASPHASAHESLRETEMRTILAALVESRWNQRKAAKLLDLSYSALRRRIAKYDLKNGLPVLPVFDDTIRRPA